MKGLVQRGLSYFGYALRRTDALRPFAPFVRHFKFPGAEFDMWIANAEAGEWYNQPHQEPLAEKRALRELISPGDRVLEIGSHHGFTGLLLANYVGENGFVLGVEANPQNAMIDQAQLALNGVRHLKFIHAAGGERAGKLKISSDHNGHICADGIEVPAVTGDDLDAQYGPFDAVKIDVEGYEVEVLRGCKQLLTRCPKLAIELHMDGLPERGYSLDDIWKLIDLKRYEGTMIVVPAFDSKLELFDPAKIPARDPDWSYFAVNVFLRAKQK
ncbi:MAG TPA: FkbM family methyltransferase [Candidatus Acidoferrales bacterium]|nr:FkbM family methyltransferase [Candidatus Acidoferrales bacterium]